MGPTNLTRSFALDDFPAYVRDGTIIPLNVSRAYTGLGDATSANLLTWAIWPHGTNEFTVTHPDRSGTTTVRVEADTGLRLTVTGIGKPHRLRILWPSLPREVVYDGAPLQEGADWRYEDANRRLWITTTSAAGGSYEVR